MNDQKIENILNLALDVTETEREKSESLDVGYDAETRTWQVIVRFHGDLQSAARPGWIITLLTGGYAIIRIPQADMNLLASLPEVEYIEKPKLLYFSVDQGRTSSCVSALQTPQYDLLGTGVLIAVIDSGVDYFHPDFRNEDGASRILAIWDQTTSSGAESAQTFSYAPPAGFSQGIEYTKEMIDAALATGSRASAMQIVPERDVSGHGTNVLGIAAGNGMASGGRYHGMAPHADLLVVKLGNPEKGGFPRTTEVMQAVEYVVRKAQTLAMPAAVNLSFGNTYGSHRGTSLLETYLNMMAERWKISIIAGVGNEGNSAGHFSAKPETSSGIQNGIRNSAGTQNAERSPAGMQNETGRTPAGTGLLPDSEISFNGGGSLTVEFSISDYEPTMNLQFWKNYADEFLITLTHPNGETAGPFGNSFGTMRFLLGNTELLVYCGQPDPYQSLQEIYFEFLPVNIYLDAGIWKLSVEAKRVVSGAFDIWMPDSRARNESTHFLRPTPDTTLTIPSAASRLIAVGAYDSRRMTYASFSGRGRETDPFYIRPDLAAPGVDITTTAPGGGYVTVSGTSFAASFVTGAAALLMEWGIVKGKDPYLYGEKLRASLHRGARQLTAEKIYPNPRIGYGALCVKDSLTNRSGTAT